MGSSHGEVLGSQAYLFGSFSPSFFSSSRAMSRVIRRSPISRAMEAGPKRGVKVGRRLLFRRELFMSCMS